MGLPLLFLVGAPIVASAAVCGVTANTTQSDNLTSANYDVAGQFVATMDCQVTDIKILVSKNGSPASRPFYIYDDSGGLPNNVVLTGSSVVPTNTLPTYGYEDSTVSGGTCLTSGATYYAAVPFDITDVAGVQEVQTAANNNETRFYRPAGVNPWLSAANDGVIFEVDGTLCAAPVPPNGLAALIDMATSTYQTTTGISMADATTWTSDNLLKLFLGSGIATLYVLRYWIVALMIFAAVVYFSFRALGFFKY